MRKASILIAGLAAATTMALVGCDVEKTREGNVSVPKYEVEKKAEGDVTLPKYDVTAPDVKVGTTQAEVNVPKIQMEKETMQVPTIGITTADEKKKQEVAQGANDTQKR